MDETIVFWVKLCADIKYSYKIDHGEYKKNNIINKMWQEK